MITNASKIEALLFMSGEPISKARLLTLLKISIEELDGAIAELTQTLEGRGIVLVHSHDALSLGTSQEASEIIAALKKEELEKELSKASLETLSIILYKNGATRNEIDYIRGVNSSFILRNLAIRGLVEKTENPNDKRTFIYKPTIALLGYLGITNVTDLPNFSENIAALSKQEEAKLETEETVQ